MPRPDLPEGLYISVSQLKCYLQCPRKYELKYIRGEVPAFVPVALAFGSAFHEALASYYGELKTAGSPLKLELMLDVFRGAWVRASEGPVPLQADELDDDAGIEELTDRGVTMLHAFHAYAERSSSRIRVEAVEHSFGVTIHDPGTGEVLDETLVGTMDLVIDEGGRRIVVEHKTAARRYGDDRLLWDPQPTAYQLAARESGLGDVGLRFQVVTKTRVPAVQVADITRNAQDEGDFLRTIVGVLKAIDAGVSYPVRGWQCRTCPYAHACKS